MPKPRALASQVENAVCLHRPATSTTAVVGAFGFCFLVASIGGRMPVVGLALLVAFLLLTVLSLSPMTEAVTAAAFGALLAFVSLATPPDPEPRL